MIVKEYIDEKTKIRIHDDFCSTKEKENEVKEIIISLFIKNINKSSEKICKQ
ncbi:MAG: hypothetical protein HFJ57_00575 [Clostridia bacterium]|nr:hypothetical protein [Clostridia bacterium]